MRSVIYGAYLLKLYLIECIACPNCTKFHTALPLALSNTHTKCKADKLNGSQDMHSTVRQISGIIRYTFP